MHFFNYFIIMFHKDLISYVCNYLTDYNYYLMNKSIYKMIQLEEKNNYWKQKYDNFFKTMDKEYLILKGNYNWKREYLRIIEFQYWSNINNSLIFPLYPTFLRELPKKLNSLTNLQFLYFPYKHIKEIPKELGNLISLQYLYFP